MHILTSVFGSLYGGQDYGDSRHSFTIRIEMIYSKNTRKVYSDQDNVDRSNKTTCRVLCSRISLNNSVPSLCFTPSYLASWRT